MKQLILILALALSINAFAQDADKTVTLVVSGQGKTQDEAKQVALRSAIEQAFGAFISSKTEIMNDSLVKDEIVSVTNGNIQKFEIVSEVKIPEGGFATTLKAIVSVTKLTSFCESKGVEVEFKGGVFAANIKQKLLSEEAERIAIFNLCEVSWKILSNSIDYELEIGKDPLLISKEEQKYGLPIVIKAKANANKGIFNNYFSETIKKLSMSEDNLGSYKASNIPTYSIKLSPSNEIIYLRSRKSLIALKNLILWSNKFYLDFKLISNIDTFGVYSPYGFSKNTYNQDFGTDLFSLGFNPLVKQETWGEMKERSKKNALIESCIPVYNKDSYTNTYSKLNSFNSFQKIITRYKEFTNKPFQLKTIWDYELLWETVGNFVNITDFMWYRQDIHDYGLSFLTINLDTTSALDIYINRVFNLLELEKFTGYKIIKSPLILE
jgi:hypothetical protein